MVSTSITAFFRGNDDNFTATVNRMGRTSERFERKAQGSFQKVNRQMAALGVAFGGFSAGLAVRELGRFAEAANRIDNLLIAVGDNSDEFKRRLLAVAIETRAPLEGLANALLRLQKADPTASLDQSLERIATFQRLSLFGGRTSAEASSAALQLSQAIQSGQLSGDEFRSISENAAPKFLNEVARLAGVSRSELKATASQGKLTSDLLIQALDNLSGFSREAIAELPKTLSQASQAVSDSFTVLTGELDDSLSVTDKLASVLTGLAGIFEAGSRNADLLAEALTVLVQTAGAAAGIRGFLGVKTAIEASNVAARAALITAQQQSAQGVQTVARLQAELLERQRLVGVAQQELAWRELRGQSLGRIEAAEKKVNRERRAAARAANSLILSEGQLTTATIAVSAAQGRLALSSRIAARGMAVLRSVVSFFGGLPGVIALGTFALFQFAQASRDISAELAKADQAVAQLAERTQAVTTAEDDYAAAIKARAEAASTANADELKALDDRITKTRELADAELDRLIVQQELARQNVSVATAAVARQFVREENRSDSRFGVVSLPFQADILAEGEAARRRAVSDPEGSVRDELAYYQERLRLGEELNQKERDRIPIVEAQVAKLDDLIAGDELILRLQTRQAETTDVVTRHIERNAIAQNAATAAVASREGVLARVADNEAKLNALQSERAILQAALAVPERLSAEYANQLRQELEAVNTQIERFAPIVEGSRAELKQMQLAALALREELGSAAFDRDGQLRGAADGFLEQLDQALASTGDLDAVSFANLVAQWLQIESAADKASEAMNTARDEAMAASQEWVRAQAFRSRFAGEELVFGQPVVAVGQGDAPPTIPSPSRSNAGGGGRRVDKDMEAALTFIRAQRTEQETQAQRLLELVALRKRLVSTYGEEAEVVANLDTALERMQRQSLDWAKSLTTDILKAVAAGRDLDDILNLVFSRIFDAALSGVVENVFGAIQTGAAPAKSGGASGFLGSVLNLFGFEKGGIMTPHGPLPLRQYARGGIANSPQLALFGEGSGPEAFVPLDNGAIPVRLNVPNLDKINGLNLSRSQAVQYVDQTSIVIDGAGRDSEQLVALLRGEMSEREARMIAAIRDANEDDPNFLR